MAITLERANSRINDGKFYIIGVPRTTDLLLARNKLLECKSGDFDLIRELF